MRRSFSMLVLVVLAAAASARAQTTLLYFNSEPGDFIGQGQQFTFTPADGTINASRNFDNGVSISFSGAEFWSLDFVAPGEVALQPGQYEGATRFPFQSPTQPGLSVFGDGRGCNTLTGRFVVLEAVYGAGGAVQQFAADYEQHCESASPALYGSVRFNSAVTVEPRLSVGPARVYEGDAGTLQMRFVISLSAPAPGPVSVQYMTVDGTATGGGDYASVSGTANFPAGETQVTVTVLIVGDQEDEADETFTLSLLSPVGAPVAFGQGTGTIVDDDPLKTLLYFNSQPGDFIGQGQIFTLTPVDGTFTAVRNSDNGVSLDFNGEDLWSADFAGAGDVPLAVGAYTGAVRYPFQGANNGLSISGAGHGCNTLTGRFVVLEILYGSGNTVQRFAADYEQHCEGGLPALFGSVRYNSSIPLASRLFTGPASITEGNTGTVSLNVPVWLSEPPASPVTVSYATVDGTAVAGADYASASGTLNFPAGTASATVPILVAGDTLDEPNETFEVVLTNPSGAILSVDRGRGTILDDDPMPQLSVGDAPVAEGDPGRPGTAGFGVSLNTVSGQAVCFNYSTLQGTAQVGVDFLNTFGMLCIPAGTTTLPVNVPLVGDLDPEADEGFSLQVTGVTGATVTDGQGAGVILDDDSGTDFYTLAPCRLVDTRLTGTPVGANTVYDFAVGSVCGVPVTAKAVVVNVLAFAPTDSGSLRLYPTGTPAPLANVLHFSRGRTLASIATVTLGADGKASVRCDMPSGSTGNTQLVVDVYGYFQ